MSEKLYSEPEKKPYEIYDPVMEYENDILNERQKSWGDAVETHERLADILTAILGPKLNHPVTAYEVALYMVGMKTVRASINPYDPDSLIDASGYIEIATRIRDETIFINRD